MGVNGNSKYLISTCFGSLGPSSVKLQLRKSSVWN